MGINRVAGQHFVGRRVELERLQARLAAAAGGPGPKAADDVPFSNRGLERR